MDITAVYIMLVCFWILLAIAVFCLCSFAYVSLMYWKWARDDREREFIADCVKEELDGIIVDSVND